MRKTWLCLCLIFWCAACVEMRDYTGKKNGGVVVFSKTEFGSGQSCRDYYKIDDTAAIIVDDTKNEIVQKLGSPSTIERRADGDETWAYPGKNLQLVFDGDYLKHWRKIKE